jgi:hypothetical protein
LTKIFSTNYEHIKVQDLTIKSRKSSFHFIIGPHVNKYIFQAQHSSKRP